MVLPCYGPVSAKLGSLARELQSKPVFHLAIKIRQFYCAMLMIALVWELQVSLLYRVPCVCGSTCIGQTGWSVDERIAVHSRYIWLQQLEKSGLSDHCSLVNHQWDQVQILVRVHCLKDWVILESLLNTLEPQSVNRDAGFTLINYRKPLLPLADRMGRR